MRFITELPDFAETLLNVDVVFFQDASENLKKAIALDGIEIYLNPNETADDFLPPA